MYRIVTRGYCYTLEINTFIQHECIKLIKSDDKAVLHCCKKKIVFQINAELLNFLLIKES